MIDVQKTLEQEDRTVPVLHCGDYAQEYVMTETPAVCGCGD